MGPTIQTLGLVDQLQARWVPALGHVVCKDDSANDGPHAH